MAKAWFSSLFWIRQLKLTAIKNDTNVALPFTLVNGLHKVPLEKRVLTPFALLTMCLIQLIIMDTQKSGLAFSKIPDVLGCPMYCSRYW